MPPRKTRKNGRRAAKKSNKPKTLSKNMRTAVVRIVKGQLETKSRTYYGGALIASVNEGDISTRQRYGQNPVIINNATATDIHRVIPFVSQGLEGHQRLGNSIQPLKLKIDCQVQLNPDLYTEGTGYQTNIVCVAYLLQNRACKTYQTLFNPTTGSINPAVQNDFSQLLDAGNGGTINFDGTFFNACLPVAKQFYTLIKKHVFTLRQDGVTTNSEAGLPVGSVVNANAAPMAHRWSWNLDERHLPAHYTYPDVKDGNVTATFPDNPTNSSLFWCMGYYDQAGNTLDSTRIYVSQEYVSTLWFKDA